MFDRVTGRIGFEITFRDIGLLCGAVDQDVIPGSILRRRIRAHIPLIPVHGTAKERVHVDDDTAIVEKAVMDDLSNCEIGSLFLHGLDLGHDFLSYNIFLPWFRNDFQPLDAVTYLKPFRWSMYSGRKRDIWGM